MTRSDVKRNLITACVAFAAVLFALACWRGWVEYWEWRAVRAFVVPIMIQQQQARPAPTQPAPVQPKGP